MRSFFRRLGLAAAALCLVAGGVAYSQVALRTGPMEPNQILAVVNQLITDVNAQSGNFVRVHLRTNGNPPVLTSCGTSPAITGTDVAGTVTMGTGNPTGCVITFAAAYAAQPHCVVSWIATPLASQSYATTTTAITLTQTATSSNVVKYICFGQSGG